MTSILNPDVPAGAYDAFLPGALPLARAQRPWTPADGAVSPSRWKGAWYVDHVRYRRTGGNGAGRLESLWRPGKTTSVAQVGEAGSRRSAVCGTG
ncbi:hypothetical protein ACIBQ1_48180 [Nonomuraea sp. NPDC050153]|uniref:hypothetical protein n=1 Tax=Nonomuraea sp. NPDC050153 TaxID=3364359 RepID=UPI0037B42FE3